MQTNEGELCVDFVIMSEEEEVIAKGDAFVLRRVDPQPTSSQDSLAGCAFELAWREKQLPSTSQTSTPHGSWLIVADSMGVGDAMAMRLRAEGWNCTVAVPSDHFEVVESQLYHFNPQIPGDFSRLTKEAFDKTLGCAGAIHLLGLDAEPFEQTTTATLLRDERHVVTTAISLAQALTNLGLRTSPKLVLVTRGACDTGDDGGTVSVIQSSLWGLGRTISLEHPALECTCIDLPRRTFPEEIERLTTELLHSDGEDQIALRATGRYVARIARANVDNAPAEEFVAPEHINGRRFRLGTTKPGILDRLALFETQRQTLDAHHVEIEVEAAGLNFLDVLLAMGILPDDTPGSGATDLRLGLECAGRIVALGEGVTDLRVGQEVIALGLGSMASHVVTTRHLVAAKPEGLEWEDAATLPIVFLTAYLSLAHVAHLGRGERVLIHAGTGGVGMAAIQWAKHVGAEVFATAGSESKRDLLRSLGVHHVMDSRSLSFVDDIRRITHGEGVDVVLNSLSGEFIPASFGLLRDYGRFIEIGKRDYYEDRSIGLKPFLKNLSYTLVDVRGMMLKRPERIASLFAEILALFRTGVFKPLPHQVYGASRAADAFTRMAQARHTGKIAIAMRDPEALLVPQSHSQSAAIRNDGTYLITGGLGGLGLSLAQWMVHQGARNLALVGRSAPSETTQKAIEDMRAEGAFICTVRADVSQMEGTRAVLEQIQSMPPLRGVVHAAAALDDHTLLELEPDHVERVFAPKARGAWNLHEATKHSSLDFFVMYSSATALLGSPGQANYAAANAFLDAFAIARRAIGLPAQSIQWGPFSNVGMAARAERRGARLARHGLDSLSPDEGSLAFARILGGAPAALCVMHFSVRQWLESYPQAAASPYFSELRKESAKPPTSATGTMREELERMAPGQRFEHLERHVLQQLGRVIRLDVARIDARASFTSLGIDSLMSLELRNRLESSLGLRLPPTLLFTYANPSALTKHLLDQLLPHDSTPRNPDRHQGASAVAAAEKHLALPEADDELLAAFDASVRDIKTEMSS